MAMRSTDAATTPAGPEQAGKNQAGTGQGATDWTEQALYAGAREEGIPGVGSPWRWFFSGVWLIYLIQPVADLFQRHDAVWIAGGVIITLAFCVIYESTFVPPDADAALRERLLTRYEKYGRPFEAQQREHFRQQIRLAKRL